MQRTRSFIREQAQQHGVVLNEVQQQVVRETEGPMLILASPGSGKTTTMMMRIGHLIEVKGVAPRRIKALTFSRAAAADMEERFARFFPYLPPVDFSTIHRFAFEVVRTHLRENGIVYRIIEGDGQQGEEAGQAGQAGQARQTEMAAIAFGQPVLHKKALLRQLYRSIAGDNMTDDQMDALTTYISYIKNKMIPPHQWGHIQVDVPEAARIAEAYEDWKKNGSSILLIDYDDMLTMAEQLLAHNAPLLLQYQQRYDYILTDESQDTSMVQHALIERLVAGHRNLCVVADDDQSIYSWRGAEPSYLLQFQQVYPEATILYMEQNYRSTAAIVDTANTFIQRNKLRYAKQMFTANDEGKPIRMQSFGTYREQITYIVRQLQQTDSLRDVAVLYRNNSSSIALMIACDRAGIPFYMKDADNRFFSHWVVQDVLNFMRMSYTDKRIDLLESIHLKLNAYISKQQMAQLKQVYDGSESVFDALLVHVTLQEYQVKLVQASKETFQQMRGMPPLHAIHVIRERLGYDKALDKMCERLGFRKEVLSSILRTLEELAVGLKTMEQFAAAIKHYESLLRHAKGRKGQEAVTFSTFHSAKGLEFERVYMIDLIEGVIPSAEERKASASDPHVLEEATRLFYVGMTRAKTHLELLVYEEKDGEAVVESPYVTEVRHIVSPLLTPPPSHPPAAVSVQEKEGDPRALRSIDELRPGRKVEHRVFGCGEIVRLAGEQVDIRFAGMTRTLAAPICLEKGLLVPV